MRVSPEIESLIPYKPGRSTDQVKRELGLEKVIKLASNENPLGPSPKAVEAIKKACKNIARYPDPSFFKLRQKLSEIWKIRIDDIIFGNGSNELIDLIIRVFCEPGDKIIVPQKSFFAYGICAQAARVGKREIPVDKTFRWDMNQFIEEFKRNRNSRERILFIANPNNPTGTYLNRKKMDYLLSELGNREDLLVVLDEAYNEYIRAEDFAYGLDYFKKYSNVMILRTFSKVFGLAGLRIGTLMANTEYTQWIHRVRNPFNVNVLAREGALAALDDPDYIEKSRQLVWKGLDDFYDFFENQQIPYIKSQGNFILFDSLRNGSLFFSKAQREGLLLRPMDAYGLPCHIRISMGTLEENEKAKEILLKIFKELPIL